MDDLARLEAVIDAAQVVDDFLSGVVGLGTGEIGDDNVARTWLQRRLRGRGQRGAVRRMAAMYAPEQLRKAANEADDLVEAVGALGDAPSALAAAAHERLAAIGIGEVPALLRSHGGDAWAPAVHDARRRVRGALSICDEARSRALLDAMRRRGHQG